MKKMFFGALLTIIGLSGIITIFVSVFMEYPNDSWMDDVVSYRLGGIFTNCIILMIIGLIICGIEAFKKPPKEVKK